MRANQRWGTGFALVLALPAILAAAPLAWALGTLVPDEKHIFNPDYMWSPPSISDRARGELGVSAALVVLVTVAVLARLVRRRVVAPGGFMPALPLAALSAYVGLTYSVATAPVSGANIGGSLMVMFGIPFALMMTAVAISSGVRHARHQRQVIKARQPWPWPPPNAADEVGRVPRHTPGVERRDG